MRKSWRKKTTVGQDTETKKRERERAVGREGQTLKETKTTKKRTSTEPQKKIQRQRREKCRIEYFRLLALLETGMV